MWRAVPGSAMLGRARAMIPVFVLSLVAAAVPVELAVHVEGAASPCAFDQHVPAALRRMLPGLAITAAPTVPPRGLALVITPRATDVDLELVSDDPAITPTRRTLPSPPEACAATADGIALVVERHLRDLGWVPPSMPPKELAPASEARTEAPASELPIVWSLAARGTGALGLDPNRSDGGPTSRLAGGGALLVHATRGVFEGSAEVSALVMGAEDIPRRDRIVGTISAWALAVMLRGGACLDLAPRAPIALCANAGGGVERATASTTGAAIFRSRSASVLAPILSGVARAELALSPRLSLTLDAGALVRPTRTIFAIEGASTSYRIPRTDLRGGLGVRVTIF